MEFIFYEGTTLRVLDTESFANCHLGTSSRSAVIIVIVTVASPLYAL